MENLQVPVAPEPPAVGLARNVQDIQGTPAGETSGNGINEGSPATSVAGDSNPSGTIGPIPFHDTQGTIEVNGSGQLRYTLPIALPPGVKSVAPQVNLAYTSGSGNGIAGYGWHISGITAVSRTGKNMDRDGESREIRLDYADPYQFNGQRLVLKSGEYGKDGAVYVTEKYSNTRIRSVGTSPGGNGPAYFEVSFEDGSQAWYGSSADARTPTEYNIVRWQDARGNYIVYNYLQGDHVALIDSIEWGGNETVGTPHFNSLVFSYIPREVRESSYVNGTEFIQHNLLSAIEVRAGGNLFKRYTIEYNRDDHGNRYRFLKSITETNSLGEAANPVVFDYRQSQQGSWKQTWVTNDTSPDLLYGDFDGDGKIDILKYADAFQECLEYREVYHEGGPSGGEDDYQTGYWESHCVQPVDRPAGIYHFGSIFDDERPRQVHVGSMITGEQLKKAVVCSLKNAVGEVLSRQGFATYRTLPSTGSAIAERKDLEIKAYSIDPGTGQLREEFSGLIPADSYDNTIPRPTDTPPQLSLYWQDTQISSLKEMDLDGDGLSELVFTLADTLYWEENSVGPDGSVQVPDLRSEMQYRYLIVRPGESDPSRLANTIYITPLDRDFFGSGTRQGDFNGDGTIDFLTFDSAEKAYLTVFRKDPSGNFYARTTLYSDAPVQGLRSRAIAGDFTGDGRTDLLVPQGVDSWQWKLYIATGTGFRVQTLENFELYKENFSFTGSAHARFINRQYLAQDLNGDGKADFIAFYSHILAHYEKGTTTKFMFLYHENKGMDASGNVVFEKVNIDKSVVRDRGAYKMDWYPDEYDRHWTYVEAYASHFTNQRNGPPAHFSPLVGDFRVNRFNENILVFRQGRLVRYSHYSVAEEALITSIAQGGITTEIDYKELDPSIHPGFYAGLRKEQYPYVELDRLPRTFAVSRLTQEGRKQDFKYRGFTAHLQGKGMIGFRRSARSSWYADGFENTVIWAGTETDPLNEGLPIKDWSVRTFDDDRLIFPEDLSAGSAGLLSFNSTEYAVSTPSEGVKAIVPVRSLSKDFLKDITEETLTTYGPYYLPEQTVSRVNGDFSVAATLTAYVHNPEGHGRDYYIGRLVDRTGTIAAYGDTLSAREEYSYENNLLKTLRTHNRDGSGWMQESYGYDGFGNITEKTISSSVDGMVRREASEYEAKGRFVIRRTDPIGLETRISYNDWGQVLEQTDPSGDSLANTYDSWGKLLTAATASGGITGYTYEKLANGGSRVTEYAPDGTPAETYTDRQGRQYLTRTRGFNRESYIESLGDVDVLVEPGVDTHSSVATVYDVLGRRQGESEPYHDSDPPRWNTISYDDSVYPAVVTALAFNGKQVKTTLSGRTTMVEELSGYHRLTRKTTDALDHVVTSEDSGGIIHFSYNAAGEQVGIIYGSNTVTTRYDVWGRRAEFHDPSNGLYRYEYNGLGQLIRETGPKGYKEYSYNAKGQLVRQTEKSDETGLTDKEINFAYDSRGLLTERTGTSDGRPCRVALAYDAYGRLLENREESHGRTYVQKNIRYDDQSRVVSYQKGLDSEGTVTEVAIEYVYDPWSGLLHQVKDGTSGQQLWRLQQSSAGGQLVRGRLGAATIKNTYDDNNFLRETRHESSRGLLLGSSYTFDAVRNELKERTRAGSFALTETFSYDDNNRLTGWTDPGTGATSSNSYDRSGRIIVNDRIGTLQFGNISMVYQPTGVLLNAKGQQYYLGAGIQGIVYNENNDPLYISGQQGDVRFVYGLTGMRQLASYGGKAAGPADSGWEGQFTRYYSEAGDFEVLRDNTTGQEKHILYIGSTPYESNMVYLKEAAASAGAYLFLHRDYLGSILAISDEGGSLLEERHFDAWGNLGYGSMVLLERGYTGHEHFVEVGIIHMNGRLYDPVLRRFLNPDANIQDRFNTQNYNKYGYVLNNPLLYNDPSGEFFVFIGLGLFWTAVLIGAAVGLAGYTVGLAATGNLDKWNLGGALKATFFGAVSGAATFGIGEVFKAAAANFGNALLQAGAHGVSQSVLGLVQGQDFLGAFAGGFAGSLGAYGWGKAMGGLGLEQFSGSTYGTVTFGAISGGVGAELSGGNFWRGAMAGGIVAGLNHTLHKISDPFSPQEGDEGKRKKREKLLNHIKGGAEIVKDAGAFVELIDALDKGLGKNIKIFGKYGDLGGFMTAGGQIIYDGVEYQQGNISGYRFSFRLGATITSAVVGAKVGAAMGGPAGFVAGTVIGTGAGAVELSWDTIWPQFIQSFNRFYNSTVRGVMRYH